jgi:hypothetical protein
MKADLLLDTQTLVPRDRLDRNAKWFPAVLELIDQHRFYSEMLAMGFDHEEKWTQAERDYRRKPIEELLESIEYVIDKMVGE